MNLSNTDGENIYSEEVKQYGEILTSYMRLTDVDYLQAFNLMKQALELRERFSEIFFIERRNEKIVGVKDAALKERVEQLYKILGEIHTGCRMIWARGKDELGVG